MKNEANSASCGGPGVIRGRSSFGRWVAGDRSARFAAGGLLVALVALGPSAQAGEEPAWTFIDVTAGSGIAHAYRYDPDLKPIEPRWICGGAAVADVEGDGDLDLYFVGGELGVDRFFLNAGDGTFTEASARAGLAASGILSCGPVFVDLDGDGADDLVVPSIHGAPQQVGQPAVERPEALPRVYRNQGDGTFVDVSATCGLDSYAPSYTAAFADVDGDGDLDAFLSRWNFADDRLMYRNAGDGTFVDASLAALGPTPAADLPYTFTPLFGDLDADGDADLVIASDFGQSRVLHNNGDGSFVDATDAVIDDENGMGAVLADFNGDGALDWFVSSIWDPDGDPEGGNWGMSGNRFYRGRGDGSFVDRTNAAGVRFGYWGWGACAGDFDLDGDLDLFHVNGFSALGAQEFHADPARLYLNRGDGTFDERSAEVGLDDSGQGRGVVCFDADRDGDLDVLIAQNDQPMTLYRNDLPAGSRHLTLALSGPAGNTRGVGARVDVNATIGGVPQRLRRDIQTGGGFVGQTPAEAHFGLGDAATIDGLRILWPDGSRSVRGSFPASALGDGRPLAVSWSEIFSDGFERGDLDAWN